MMAEGGDSVDSGGESCRSFRDKVPGISSLYLGSDGIEPMLCREHRQECQQFCRGHMIELCMKCTKMEHKHCKTVMDIKEAAEKIKFYSKFHDEKIGTSIKDLNEGFKDLKAVAEELKNKLPEKRQNVFL